MNWAVDLADELEAEWRQFPIDVQDEILAHGRLLEHFGPLLWRPRVEAYARYKAHLAKLTLRNEHGSTTPRKNR